MFLITIPRHKITSFIPKRRKDYLNQVINLQNTSDTPIQQFDNWYKEAEEFEYGIEVNSFVLSTLDSDGFPSSRFVLMKKYDKKGFIFLTHLNSPKAIEILNNNKVSGLFYWPTLNRQVRFKGTAERTDKETDKLYFDTYSIKTKMASIMSPQSQLLTPENKDKLKEGLRSKIRKENLFFDINNIWGGFKIFPEYFEFWQGHRTRAHDRICYKADEKGLWDKYMVYP